MTRHRQQTLERYLAAPEVSVLIIGAGINGVGFFRELALQGVDALLVERGDFCSGASAASSRMIHGGLRYLEFGEFRLVLESLRERNLLLQNAPHYVRPLRTIIPVMAWWSGMGHAIAKIFGFGRNRPPHRGAVMIKLGLMFYDFFTRKKRLTPGHRFASRGKALEKRPQLNPALRCTATYYDGWISYPERLGMELVLDAEAASTEARALNYVSAEGAAGGAVSLLDSLSGKAFQVRPKCVVNATGGWIDLTNRKLGMDSAYIGGTKGAHLVLDNDELFKALDGDMIYYETPDGRVSVALPWLGRVLIGSTDIRVEDPDEVRCTEEEIDYILSAVAEAFPNLRIERSQIVSHFTGVRPLPRSDASTVQVSRDHSSPVIEGGESRDFPVYSMVGGKWTTFRGFSEQLSDDILRRLGRTRKTSTESVPIGGGNDFPSSDAARNQWLVRLRKETGLPEERLADLLERYGTRAEDFARYLVERADTPLEEAPEYSLREIQFICAHERVAHLDDLVLRRTALALLGKLTPGLLDRLADILAGPTLLAWTAEQKNEEKRRCLRILEERHGIDLRR